METDNDLIRRSDLIKAMERVKKYIHDDYLHVVDEQINTIPKVESEPVYQVGVGYGSLANWCDKSKQGYDETTTIDRVRKRILYTTPQDQEYSDEYTISKIDECNSLNVRIKELEGSLIRLRDCDWVISLPDRMDAVRDIARNALKDTK